MSSARLEFFCFSDLSTWRSCFSYPRRSSESLVRTNSYVTPISTASLYLIIALSRRLPIVLICRIIGWSSLSRSVVAAATSCARCCKLLNCYLFVAVLFFKSSSLRLLIARSFSTFPLLFVAFWAFSAAKFYSLILVLRTSFFDLSVSSVSWFFDFWILPLSIYWLRSRMISSVALCSALKSCNELISGGNLNSGIWVVPAIPLSVVLLSAIG